MIWMPLKRATLAVGMRCRRFFAWSVTAMLLGVLPAEALERL